MRRGPRGKDDRALGLMRPARLLLLPALCLPTAGEVNEARLIPDMARAIPDAGGFRSIMPHCAVYPAAANVVR